MSQTVPPLHDGSTGSSPLQFDRAEFAEAPASASCTTCQRAIDREYYEVNGKVVCAACRGELTRWATEGSGARRFARALVAGAGAGAVGSLIYFAITKLTGYEFGLIAVLVGFAVGGAVRWGCHGRGGRVYQALAVALTYLAIVSTYVPDVIEGFRNSPSAEAATAAPAEPGAVSVSDQSVATVDAAPPAPTAGGFVFAIAFVMFIACLAPFLAGLQNVVGLAIIGFGLWEAWKINRRPELTITGPHQLASTVPPFTAI